MCYFVTAISNFYGDDDNVLMDMFHGIVAALAWNGDGVPSKWKDSIIKVMHTGRRIELSGANTGEFPQRRTHAGKVLRVFF